MTDKCAPFICEPDRLAGDDATHSLIRHAGVSTRTPRNVQCNGAQLASLHPRAACPRSVSLHIALRAFRIAAVQTRPDAVDVIVPVYGAPKLLARCLDSIARHTDLTRHGLLLVVDGPQQAAVERCLAAFAPAQILRSETRRGFAETANLGMLSSTREVILLNSDTVVTARWVEKMIDAASSAPKIGTVTPLSNNATLCSVPRAFEENLLPVGHDIDSFAALVERVTRRSYIQLPTAVGFCMYVRRALIDDIGPFDAKTFAAGYGEENDFCLRAAARGWSNIVDDATFIWHAGAGSFGAQRARLQRKAARRLSRRHPSYNAAVAAFMRDDPMRDIRRRIVDELRNESIKPKARRGPARVLHVVHGWPPFQLAGTEFYAHWLVQRQLQWRDVSVFARLDDPKRAQGSALELCDRGARVRLVANNFVQRDPLARNAIRDVVFERAFTRFLDEEQPELVHLHHLAGHSFSLAGIAARRGVPVVQQIQDWWAMCARTNLCDRQSRRCSGPSIAKCASCAPLTRIAPAPLWNRLLHEVRREAARRSLYSATVYVMGSHAIRDDYARNGLLARGTPAYVIPYGVELPSSPRTRTRVAGEPLRFGFIGSILPHKGLHVAAEAMRAIDAERAHLHVWGRSDVSPEYTARVRELAPLAITFEGTFDEERKGEIFRSLDLLLIPSVGLESFGLAAREAMACGVPIIAVKDGALAELFDAPAAGAFFPNGDVVALTDLLQRVVDDPQRLDSWAAQIAPPKSADAHAEEIEAVYEKVLASR